MPRQRNTVVINENYKKASENFYQTLVNLGYTMHSCRNGYYSVEYFLYFIEQKGISEISHISGIHLAEYQNYLQLRPNQNKGGTLNPKTIHHHIRYLHRFFEQQQQQGKITVNPFDSFTYRYPNSTERERNVLTQKEIRLLYRQAESGLEEALLALAYGCGLRAGEIEQLNMEDVNFREQFLIVKQGKGNKRRVVPLAAKVSAQLENYLRERLKNKAPTKAFLLNCKQHRLRQYTGNKLLQSMAQRTKNAELQQKEISLHVLRHSIATHLLEEGLALEKVRDFLGHCHIETTAIYTHISPQQINQLIMNDL